MKSSKWKELERNGLMFLSKVNKIKQITSIFNKSVSFETIQNFLLPWEEL